MTNYTRLIGTTTALVLASGACADLQYGDAILSAESNCFAGTQRDLVQQTLGAASAMEASSSCGGGSTSASLETGDSWFVLSAGSTVPGQGSSGSDAEVPIIVDGGNGHGAVELQFTVDAPTLFRMSRALEGSKVRFWDGDYQIAELKDLDEETPLPQGTYWATIETDQYGTPVWAEIEWSQQADEKPADLNKDGRLDEQDLAILVKLVSESKDSNDKPSKGKQKPSEHSTGGTCTDAGKDAGKQKPSGKLSAKDRLDGATPLPRPKPQQGGLASADGKFEGNVQPSDSHPQFGNGSSSAGDDKGSAKGSRKVLPIELPKVKRKGDLDGDGKVDIKDIVFLLARI